MDSRRDGKFARNDKKCLNNLADDLVAVTITHHEP
jgi:hypothetical protein